MFFLCLAQNHHIMPQQPHTLQTTTTAIATMMPIAIPVEVDPVLPIVNVAVGAEMPFVVLD
jgi:hypothetical protein